MFTSPYKPIVVPEAGIWQELFERENKTSASDLSLMRTLRAEGMVTNYIKLDIPTAM